MDAKKFVTLGTGWKQSAFLPNTPYPTGGGAGCLVLGNYLYAFGNIYAQRLPLLPYPPTSNKWEMLLSNLPQNITNATCIPNPTYHNQIFIIPEKSGGNYYIFDIYAHTWTPFSFGTALPTNYVDFGEACNDNKLYVMDSGAYLFVPTTAPTATMPLLVGSGTLTSISDVPLVSRGSASYILVPFKDLVEASLIGGTCTGC
jgi:hypothetical protein